MGWTGIFINKEVTPRKAIEDEIKRILRKEFELLKIVGKGSTYYCAIKDKTYNEVFGMVIPTSVSTKHCPYYQYELIYKTIAEQSHPYYYDCPKSILNLLSPTEDDEANKWRAKCRKNMDFVKPSTLPVGTTIKILSDKPYLLRKMPPNYQFKRNWWYVVNEHKYQPVKDVNDASKHYGYEIVTESN